MAFVPTLADIPDEKVMETMKWQRIGKSENKRLKVPPISPTPIVKQPSNQKRFVPTLADIPKPSAQPAQANDNELPLRNYPFVNRPPTPQETKQTGQDAQEALIGGVQGLGNIVPDTANMLNPTKHQMPRFDFAPKTAASEVGQMAAPFAGPQALETGALSVLKFLPKALKSVKSLMAAKPGATVTNALKSIGKTSAKVGYVNALEHPENAWSEFGKGAALGAGSELLVPAALSSSPIISKLAKGAIGGTAGYYGGQALGLPGGASAAAGASMAAGLPVRRLMGIEPKAKVVNEMLSGVNESEASPVINANRRLGTNVTPGQASNNYVTRAEEERLKNAGGDVAQRAVELEKQAAKQQNNAFSSMLDKIYKPTKTNEKAINQLYKMAKSSQYDLDPIVVNAMSQEPIVKQAMEAVDKLPSMEFVPKNNYEYLQRVKQQLDTMHRTYRASTNASEKLESANIGNVRNVFNEFLKDNNEPYKQANALAHPRFVREDVTDIVNRVPGEATGKQVYSALFRGRRREKEVMELVKNFPEAKKDIQDMKIGWKHLNDMKSPSQSGAQAAANIDMIRNTGNAVANWLSKMGSSKGSMSRLEFIHSPKWEEGFAQRAEIADQSKRIKEVTKYITQTAVKAGLPQTQISNLIDYLNSTEDSQE